MTEQEALTVIETKLDSLFTDTVGLVEGMSLARFCKRVLPGHVEQLIQEGQSMTEAELNAETEKQFNNYHYLEGTRDLSGTEALIAKVYRARYL